ncbi:MAG: amidohydrolase family protein, partial [Pseudomonadota bacterium]|nr:amidohydrolase family protein [Pseudomonadota bacterium]
MTAASVSNFVLRAHLVWWDDDPFFTGQSARRSLEDGALACASDGRIAWVGEASALPTEFADWPVVERRDGIVLPGFVDAHLHFPQTAIIGAYGTDLLAWLETYTFPEESRFGDRAHAETIAAVFADELLAVGVTSACVFSTIHPVALEALAAAFDQRGMGLLSGKTAMDRNAIPALQDSPQSAYDDAKALLLDLQPRWQGRLYLGGHHHLCGDDDARLSQLAALAVRASTPLVALNDVHFHVRSRKPLQDVLTCIRHGCTIDTVGTRLFPNAERCLKTPHEMALLFADHPDALARTVEIAGRCGFSLDKLAYEYPDELTQAGRTPAEELRHLAYEGAHRRYGETVPETVVHNIEHELALIGELSYEAYFLTVYDIVRFARSRGILCQGRGSAANSTVCFCLGITAVDPARMDLLFERFISAARDEPPDIDVDFEHERREEVIQYIYSKYGRDRAGLAATVICYRTRGAVRDVGKALGLSEDAIAAISSNISGWNESRAGPRPKSAANPGDEGKDSGDSKSRNGKGRSNRQTLAHERLGEIGLDVTSPRLAMALDLIEQIRGFPRHLSQHVGGFVLTRGPLSDYVPIENAAMQDRTVIEWDKDDLEALGLMKVDVLALGMLSCMRRCFELLEQHYGERHSLASIPAEDPAVYEMLSRGDSLGVFQVESRAQMNMLPRLRPRTFYDLVVEVAIVRPGPIQGDMVHPYLRRRNGEEPVEFPSAELEGVLGKTLGVPLFQEQAMKIAIVAAGFTPSEADQLRRAMATFKKGGMLHRFGDKLRVGMAARGYDPAFAERCFKQIEGFGSY